MANEEHLAILRQGSRQWNRWRAEHRILQPDLSGADLSGANLRGMALKRANLSGAHLSGAEFYGADLSEANLTGADLRETRLGGAYIVATIFTNLDLSDTQGLETVTHFGPSYIGTDTLFRSGGKIPESFLRGCGIPDSLIEYLPSLLGAMEPIQFYSCFISHSTKDEEFAKRLHSKMRDNNLRVWFANEDLKGGHELHEQIDEAIRVYDKFIIVLSPEVSAASG